MTREEQAIALSELVHGLVDQQAMPDESWKPLYAALRADILAGPVEAAEPREPEMETEMPTIQRGDIIHEARLVDAVRDGTIWPFPGRGWIDNDNVMAIERDGIVVWTRAAALATPGGTTP